MLCDNLLNLCAVNVIESLDAKFDSRDFIWCLMSQYEAEYIDLLVEAKVRYNTRPIHQLHKQIGQYLDVHAKELGIEKNEEFGKVSSISPFGKKSETQCWHKS